MLTSNESLTKSHSISIDNNHCSVLAKSNIQSNLLPLKLIKKTTSLSSQFNEIISNSNSDNHNNKTNVSSEFQSSMEKKQEIENLPSSLTIKLKKKKKKDKFDKHLYHNHIEQDRENDRNRSRSPISRTIPLMIDEEYRQHQKNKKHEFYRQFSSLSSRKTL